MCYQYKYVCYRIYSLYFVIVFYFIVDEDNDFVDVNGDLMMIIIEFMKILCYQFGGLVCRKMQCFQVKSWKCY